MMIMGTIPPWGRVVLDSYILPSYIRAMNVDIDTRANLLDLIKTRAYHFWEEGFVLSSGETSKYYFDMKQVTLNPKGIALIASMLDDRLKLHEVQFVAGLELGAVPLVMAACMRGYNALIVRKQPKEHGTENLIEGRIPWAGQEVIVLEDVTTTGESALKAVAAIRSIGCTVRTAITLVDRLQGATTRLAANGITLEAIFTMDDFVTKDMM